jgi:hypothetical protein
MYAAVTVTVATLAGGVFTILGEPSMVIFLANITHKSIDEAFTFGGIPVRDVKKVLFLIIDYFTVHERPKGEIALLRNPSVFIPADVGGHFNITNNSRAVEFRSGVEQLVQIHDITSSQYN